MDMINVSSVQSNSGTPESSVQNTVIKIDQIKTILYLGVKGNMSRGVREPHQIDTFA